MLLNAGPLQDDPLAAAAAFHTQVVPQVLAALAGGEPVVTVLFAPADHGHRDWRAAAIQTIARQCAPARINAVAGADAAAVAAAQAFILAAPGLTGQYLALDSVGAGPVV